MDVIKMEFDKMLKYKILGGMAWSPFRDEKFLGTIWDVGLVETESVIDADIFISDRWRRLRYFAMLFGPTKKYLFWSAEPRIGVFFNHEIKVLGGWSKIKVMSVYTGDVFYDEAYFLGWCGLDFKERIQNVDSVEGFESRKVVFLGMYRDLDENSLKVGGVDIDLNRVRIELALRGKELGFTDVYGSGYPEGIANGSSGAFEFDGSGIPLGYSGDRNNWQAVKRFILGKYHFNICLENTCYEYYITEKIWQSIQAHCLPIYHGGNRIYEYFPRGSFIDVLDYKSYDDLYAYINQMSEAEYVKRLNLCIDVYNDCMQREFEQRSIRLKERYQKIRECLSC